MGNERLNDGFTRSGLCVFAQAWPDVATESHKAKEEITDQIFVFASLGGVSQLGEDFIIERSALPCNFLFEQHDIDEDRHHIARVRQISWWIKILEFEEGVNCFGIFLYRCRTKNLFIIIVNLTFDVHGVGGHNSLISWVVSTLILYPKDLCPFYVMSLPSGPCFNIWTSL